MSSIEQSKNEHIDNSTPKQQKGFVMWVKRLGVAGFLFFLIKGLLWLIIPYLIAKGIF